jgi:sugar phosphate permease
MLTGFAGGEHSNVQFILEQTFIGLTQSICFPAYVCLISNWFSGKTRGIAVGGFCTCICIGNIIGA